MDHVAIMKKEWQLLPKILSGEKKIESRWYQNKVAPWDRVKAGETVYFKNSGEPVTLKALVENVLQFADLTPTKIETLVSQYGQKIAFVEPTTASKSLQGKRYAILIFLTQPQVLEKPFAIDKKGFGVMSAWLVVPDINLLKKAKHLAP